MNFEFSKETNQTYKLPLKIVQLCQQLQTDYSFLGETLKSIKNTIITEQMSEEDGLGYIESICNIKFRINEDEFSRELKKLS